MNDEKNRKISCDCEQKYLEGVRCGVKNCIWHCEETHCTADAISVGPDRATTSSQTLCATFREKSDT
jgi:hypothetical protein